jgi:hypothetical protein
MSKANSNDFYSKLPILNSFFDASRTGNYHSLPDDWLVGVTDIVNSTKAIEHGRYRTVNILGASPIVGLLNVVSRNEIPFCFSGDGALFCIPPELLTVAQKILADSRQIGEVEYNLDLRAAIFPISFIRQNGYDIKVARYKVSDVYMQAVFLGGGVSFAEKVLKDTGAEPFRILPSKDPASTDFSGLECRWQKIDRPGKEVITLLVKSNPRNDNPDKIYEEVLQKMRHIFGFDDRTNPIAIPQLSMSMSVFKLWGEIKFRTFGLNRFQRLMYLMKVELQVILGKVLMQLKIKTSKTDWSLYKPDLSSNSDHRKFDDMLRVVLSGSPLQRHKLEQFLQQKYEEFSLVYGHHVANSAMVTCMVFQYHREHVHFVDGSGGGYVKASKELKKRMQAVSQKVG